MYKDCYCGFCKNSRQVYGRKNVGWKHFFQAAIGALAIGLVLWKEVDPRTFVLFAFFLMLLEFSIILRRRLALVCPYCGFDPVLYSKNPNNACEKVKVFIAKRKEFPEQALLKRPLLLTPRVNNSNSRQVDKTV